MKYTLSRKAHASLIELLLPSTPSYTTLWRRSPSVSIDAFGRPVQDNPLLQEQREGLGWALTLLSRNYDLSAWTARPLSFGGATAGFYDPLDQSYIDQFQQDAADPNLDITPAELRDYQAEQLKQRHQYAISLDPQTRAYYSNLLVYLNIQLPTRPSRDNPIIAKQRDNLTTRVGFCLEAIGSKTILLPAGYTVVLKEPNHRKDHSATQKFRQLKRALLPDGTIDPTSPALSSTGRLYGNHDHLPYEPKVWRALPSKVALFTQEDVDYCCLPHVRLEDLAYEACQLNPTLSYSPVRDLPPPSGVDEPCSSTYAEQALARDRQHRTLLTAANQAAPHTYQGRDVTEAVLEAHDLYYERGVAFKNMTHLLTAYHITYNALRLLVHREHINRVLRAQAQAQTQEVSTNASSV